MKIYNNKKGFTLAELLMVVSIIGMLVALSIPIFSGQLEKSRDAVTVANLRSAYAEAQTAYLTETSSSNAKYIPAGSTPTNTRAATEAVDIVEVSGVVAKGKKDNDFSELAKSLPFKKQMTELCKEMDNNPGSYTVIFEYGTNGAIKKVSCKGDKKPEDDTGEALTVNNVAGFSYYTNQSQECQSQECLRIFLDGYTTDNRKYLDFFESEWDGQYTVLKSNSDSFTINGINKTQQTLEVLKSKLQNQYIPMKYGSQLIKNEYMYLSSIEIKDNEIVIELGRESYRWSE